jgi:hypothetical protein
MGASVRDTLAIYITLSLIATVAVAQFLYFRLVIVREGANGDDTTDTVDLDWLYESVEAWVGMEADECEPASVGDPVLVGV